VIDVEEIASLLHKILSIMHFLSAVSADKAVDADEIARHARPLERSQVENALRCCKDLGYVNENKGRFYLTYKGVLSVLSMSS
jgi:DNA-binding transcriptional ArsR family regulator